MQNESFRQSETTALIRNDPTELAEKVGTSRGLFPKVTLKRPRNLLELSKALQTDPNWLINGGSFRP
jgi:hypothetical protein